MSSNAIEQYVCTLGNQHPKPDNQNKQDSYGKGLSFGVMFIARLYRGCSTARHRHYR